MNRQEIWGIVLLAVAFIATSLSYRVILPSGCLILTSLVLGIVALVRGRIWQGALIVLLSPVAGYFALWVNARPLY